MFKFTTTTTTTTKFCFDFEKYEKRVYISTWKERQYVYMYQIQYYNCNVSC